jgi:hypothetical protein
MHATCKTCNSILITFINSLSTLLPPLTLAIVPFCFYHIITHSLLCSLYIVLHTLNERRQTAGKCSELMLLLLINLFFCLITVSTVVSQEQSITLNEQRQIAGKISLSKILQQRARYSPSSVKHGCARASAGWRQN